MREASCGSMIPAISICYLFNIICLLFSVCSGSKREASCGSMMLAISIYIY
jgi:hypothetical protein